MTQDRSNGEVGRPAGSDGAGDTAGPAEGHRYDPYTGKPLPPRFDPYTGERLPAGTERSLARRPVPGDGPLAARPPGGDHRPHRPDDTVDDDDEPDLDRGFARGSRRDRLPARVAGPPDARAAARSAGNWARRHPRFTLLVIVALIAAVWWTGKSFTPKYDVPPADLSGPTNPPERTPPNTGSPGLDRILHNDQILFAVEAQSPGLYQLDPDTGQPNGFDLEIAKLISRNLGLHLPPAAKPVPSSTREQAIDSTDVDMIIGGYPRTPEHQSAVALAGPYLTSGLGVLVTTNGPADVAALAGRTVCVVPGSIDLATAGSRLGATATEGISALDCQRQLIAGQVAAVTGDDAALRGLAATTSGLRTLPRLTEDTLWIGVKQGDEGLRKKINDILRAAERDGSWTVAYSATLGRGGVVTDTPPEIAN